MVINACGMILEMGEISIMRLRKVFIFGVLILIVASMLGFIILRDKPDNDKPVENTVKDEGDWSLMFEYKP